MIKSKPDTEHLVDVLENGKTESESSKYVTFQVYSFRWLTLVLFILSGVSNAMILLTWAPITDKADTYWGGIGLTAINLLNVIFQIMYLPGTLLALKVSSQFNDLRVFMIIGGFITSFGCFIRFIGAISHNQPGMSSSGSYSLILLGTAFVGLAQPFYLNLPAKIATTWFSINERDIATTLCSLANPLGSAIGSFIPPLFVNSEDTNDIENGIKNLLITQFAVTAFTCFLVLLFFRAKPPSPPSQSNSKTEMKENTVNMFHEITKLFSNMEYVKLFLSFTIILGHLNAIAALLNQLPGGYSNDEIGTTGAVLILLGFFGAFATGFVLEYSKSYRTILKVSYVLAFISWVFFMSNCRANNFPLFIFGAALLGLTTLPTIPSTIVSTVECSYPVPEDASVGFLYIGANIMAIMLTFVGQILLSMSNDHSYTAPFFPYGIWIITTLFLSLIPVMLFQGRYLRFEEDSSKSHLLASHE